MQLREFAERVLFATSLDEKLGFASESIVDTDPGNPLETPDAPGRPADLILRSDGVRAQFPGDNPDVLQNDEQRGVLLHFLANHELLATELMALVLLKFPDAPSAFRKGILRTLREEQEHTRLYMDRMQACGIRFGELPVNRFFWDCIANMQTPLDYVTRLSLTFEQANLDFSRHYAELFSKIGDDATANVLTKIYKDEIGHVGYGLKWFRRWKSERDSDWDAYQRQLVFPLSPNRAKGSAPFNQEGRTLAGLDSEFIHGVSVAAQSKGRTPNIYVFNPSAEGFAGVDNTRSFHPGTQARMLTRDLETIPMFLGRRDDIVLTSRQPSNDFLLSVLQAGFAVPECIQLDDAGGIPQDSSIRSRKLLGLRPWAWSPDSLELLGGLDRQVTSDGGMAPRWSPEFRELYSKTFGVRILERLIARDDDARLCSAGHLGVACEDWSEVVRAISRFREAGNKTLVIKSAFGTAGRHNFRLMECEDPETVRGSTERYLGRRGEEVVVEPWLDRELDFSVQYEFSADGELQMVGFTRLFNTPAGQFRACGVPRHLARQESKEMGRFLYGRDEPILALYETVLAELLEDALKTAGFKGALGIDAFVFRDEHGELRLKPVVEINPRYTMGRVALELARQADQQPGAILEVITESAVVRAGFAGFAAFANHLKKEYPVIATDETRPRMRSGSLCLNDPAMAEGFLAVFSLGDRTRLLV